MGKTRVRGNAGGRSRKARNGRAKATNNFTAMAKLGKSPDRNQPLLCGYSPSHSSHDMDSPVSLTQSSPVGSSRSTSPSPSFSRYSPSTRGHGQEEECSGHGNEVSLLGSGADGFLSNLESLAKLNGGLQTDLERARGQGDTSPAMDTLIDVTQTSQRMVTQNRAQIQLLSGCFQDLSKALKAAVTKGKVQEGKVKAHYDNVSIQGTTYNFFCARKAELAAKVEEVKKKVGQWYKGNGKEITMTMTTKLPDKNQTTQTEMRRPVNTAAVGTDDKDLEEVWNLDHRHNLPVLLNITETGEDPNLSVTERESSECWAESGASTPKLAVSTPLMKLKAKGKPEIKRLPAISKSPKSKPNRRRQRVRRCRSKDDNYYYILPNNRKRPPNYAYSPYLVAT